MSHFTVAVVLPECTEQALKDALQPYHEFECTGIKDQYVERVVCEDYSIESYKKETAPCIVFKSSGIFYCTKYDDKATSFWQRESFGISSSDKFILPEQYELKDLPFSAIYATYEDYLKDWCGVNVEDDHYDFEGGILYTYTNPNSQWDWWSIGGRWNGFFKLKQQHNLLLNNEVIAEEKGYAKGESSWCNEGRESQGYDIIQKRDIDLETGFDEVWSKKLKEFETYLGVKEQYPEYKTFEVCGHDRDLYWNQLLLEALKEAFKDNESYKWYPAKPESFCDGDLLAFKEKVKYDTFGTYAIVKDGKWIQKGEMGWFGCSSNEEASWETKWFELFDSVPDDHFVVLVDCHI